MFGTEAQSFTLHLKLLNSAPCGAGHNSIRSVCHLTFQWDNCGSRLVVISGMFPKQRLKTLFKAPTIFLTKYRVYAAIDGAPFEWPSKKPAVRSHIGMPQVSNTSLKSIKNIFRCIRNQQNANATTTATDIFSTFFLDSCNTRRFAEVVFPGELPLQT